MRSEPQDTESGPCWPRKPEFGGAVGLTLPCARGHGPDLSDNQE